VICVQCQTLNSALAVHCQHCHVLLPVLDELPTGFVLHDQLTVLRVLGRGGFGITYLVSTERGSLLAVKEFFPDGMVQRFHGGLVVPLHDQKLEFERLKVRAQFEAEILQLLKHPSATKSFGFWSENGTTYLALEFIQGDSLEQRIASGVKLREVEARGVLMACLEVLFELHGLGLLHRDIKPANIILSPERVELIDFGSAIKFKVGERVKRERLLTPMYAPLEQFAQEVQLTPATDFYALAATLYHGLSLVVPACALDRAKGLVVLPIRSLEPHISPSLARIIDDCLAMKLEDRPLNAKLMLEEIYYGTPLNVVLPSVAPRTLFEDLLEDLLEQYKKFAPIFWFLLLAACLLWVLIVWR
jgi:serine/threonine protein kinase